MPSDDLAADELPFTGAPPEIVAAMNGRAPTVQQWSAISHDLSPCAVVAGAGSGKTAVMAARVVYLTLVKTGAIDAPHPGALPSEILCLTFTNKAAEELARRVRAATEGLGLPEGEEVTVLTYHAFAARLLDDYGLRMGLEPGPMLLSTAHRWQLSTALFADEVFEHLEVRTVTHPVRQMLELADQCADHLVDPDELAVASEAFAESIVVKKAPDRDAKLAAQRRAELARMVSRYVARKKELHLIDYGDQIRLACDLVENHPEVGADFRARYPIVLLDEYQDTNHAQAILLGTLCGPGYPMMCVGDPDQNIYAWRGASLRNILRFAEDFAGGNKPLYVNFRSGSAILDVANVVISAVPEDRRQADKLLKPDPARGRGRVMSFVAGDARAEAARIAALILQNNEGRPWSDFAVLCRKKKLFAPIAEALHEAGIPVEVVDLGGLLAVPEVVEVVSWLRLLEDPSRNVALARILQGPRWRIGYRDLVALARWSARHNRALRDDLGEDEHPGDVAFALGEALDHLGDEDMTGLSDEARARLEEFRAVLAQLRGAATGPLGDVVTAVAEESGLLRELESSSSPTAAGARRNLLNFVGSVSSFAPVAGEATLGTLVSYLDAAEDAEEDFEQVQLSDADTVKLLTIHKAKGLEWPVVFVPGLAEHGRSMSSIFPDSSRQPNPIRQPATLPFEFRGDADVLPRYEGNIGRFRDALRERGMEEERRLCYVALTRARDVLVVSCAYWYEGPADAFRPGTFLTEIAGHEACDVLEQADRPEKSPLVEARRERAGVWPRAARASDADALFPEGWHAAAIEAASDAASVERLAGELAASERAEFERAVAGYRERTALIAERTVPVARLAAPGSLSVTSVLDYERCPKMFYWSAVRPLPRRPSEAARLGTDVHRWIELQGRGQGALFDVDAMPDLAPSERQGSPGAEQSLREAFRASRFAGVRPLFTERPFVLFLDGFVVRGRIDAVFGEPDGAWEIVDYKTGVLPPADDPVAGLQLDLYALACQEVWGKKPEDLTLTYAYLGEGVERSYPAGDAAATRARVVAALSRVAAGSFDPAPGDHCRWCDFLTFCDSGQKQVEQHPG